MPTLHDAEVSVIVDGEPLPEYKIEIDGNRINCYIPSETGKRFRIRIQDNGPRRGPNIYISSRLEMDGVSLRTLYSEEKECRWRIIDGVENRSKATFSPFYFANLEVSEDGEDTGSSSNVGKIIVKVIWTRHQNARRRLPPNNSGDREHAQLVNKTVHEKSKKLTTHRVLLGDPITTQDFGYPVKSTRVPNLPTLEFCFHYANKDLLMARDIIPNSHPAGQKNWKQQKDGVSQKRAREGEDLTVAIGDEGGLSKEEEAMLKHLQAKAALAEQARRKRIKTEVKAEPELGAQRLPVSGSGVIDLTLDD